MDQEVKNQSLGKKLIVPLVAVALFAVLVFGATYAYFSAEITANNTANLSANIPSTNTGVVTTSSQCSFDVDAATMVQNLNSNTNAVNTATCGLTITLTGASGVACSYNLVIQETTDGDVAYVKTPDAPDNEFTATVAKSGDAEYEITTETNMDAIVKKTDGAKVLATETITVPSGETEMVNSYTITQKWYNIDAKQDSHKGHIYKYVLSAQDIVC